MAASKAFKLINCVVTFDGTIVGGIQELSVKRADDNTVYHEAGNLNPKDIISGARSFDGSVKHGWLLTKTITDYMNFTGTTENDIYFNISATVNDGSSRAAIVEGVKFKGLDLSMSLNDVVELNRDFDALDLKFR
jgi:hypothetical protein